MRPWVLQLHWKAGVSRNEVEHLAADLASHDQVDSATQVAAVDGSPRLVIGVSADDLDTALGTTSSLLTHIKAISELGEPTSVRVVDRETHVGSWTRAELPDLISTSGITQRMGVSKQRAHLIRQQHDFPRPVYETGRDSLWLLSDYEQYENEHPRTPGRPRTRSDSASPS